MLLGGGDFINRGREVKGSGGKGRLVEGRNTMMRLFGNTELMRNHWGSSQGGFWGKGR